jgi:hypothetical protein
MPAFAGMTAEVHKDAHPGMTIVFRLRIEPTGKSFRLKANCPFGSIQAGASR